MLKLGRAEAMWRVKPAAAFEGRRVSRPPYPPPVSCFLFPVRVAHTTVVVAFGARAAVWVWVWVCRRRQTHAHGQVGAPFATVLREAMEAVVFVGGLIAGLACGFLVHAFASRSSAFLVPRSLVPGFLSSRKV